MIILLPLNLSNYYRYLHYNLAVLYCIVVVIQYIYKSGISYAWISLYEMFVF